MFFYIMDSCVKKETDVIELIPFTEWSFRKPADNGHCEASLTSDLASSKDPIEMVTESLEETVRAMSYNSRCYNGRNLQESCRGGTPPNPELYGSSLLKGVHSEGWLHPSQAPAHRSSITSLKDGGSSQGEQLLDFHDRPQNGLVKPTPRKFAFEPTTDRPVFNGPSNGRYSPTTMPDDGSAEDLIGDDRRMSEPASLPGKCSRLHSVIPDGNTLTRSISLNFAPGARKPKILSMKATLVPSRTLSNTDLRPPELNNNLPKFRDLDTKTRPDVKQEKSSAAKTTETYDTMPGLEFLCENPSDSSAKRARNDRGHRRGSAGERSNPGKTKGVKTCDTQYMKIGGKTTENTSVPHCETNTETNHRRTYHNPRDNNTGINPGISRQSGVDPSRDTSHHNTRRASDGLVAERRPIKPLIKSRSFTVTINNKNTDFSSAVKEEDRGAEIRRVSSEPVLLRSSLPRIPVVILEEEEEEEVTSAVAAAEEAAGSSLFKPSLHFSISPSASSSTLTARSLSNVSSSSSEELRISPCRGSPTQSPQPSSSLSPSSSPSTTPVSPTSSTSSRDNPTPPTSITSPSPSNRIPVVVIETEDDEDCTDTDDDSFDMLGLTGRTRGGSKLSASWPVAGLTVPTQEQTERLQMIADGAIKGSPSLARRRGSNVSIVSELDAEDDMDELKVLAARLNLQTRRPSYCVWKDKYINSRTLRKKPDLETQEVVVEEKEDSSDEGVQVDEEHEEEEDDWSIERKMRIDSALDWLQRELKSMRNQDRELARQLMKIRQTIHEVKLQRCTEENRETLAEAIEIEEERNEFAELFDFVPDQFSPALKSAGVTRMNISSRRFSVF